MAQLGIVTSEGLNVREIASDNARIVQTVSKGARLAVLDRQVFYGRYTWLQVRVIPSGKVGWVDARFVEVQAPPPDIIEPTPPAPPPSDTFSTIMLIGAALAAVLILGLLWLLG